MISRSFSILGTGNVAWQMARHLLKSGLAVEQVVSRNSTTGKAFASEMQSQWVSLSDFKEAEALLICIPEGIIADVVRTNSFQCTWAAHSSGSLALDALNGIEKHGVFYPIQTMSKGRLLQAEKITICIEANTDELENELVDLAELLHFGHRKMNSEQRKNAHLAAVMVNNFSNHLWHKASDFASEHGIDFRLFEPLVRESFDKFLDLGGFNAQTGPARRKDNITIEEHVEMLNKHSTIQQLYKVFSQSIKDEFER